MNVQVERDRRLDEAISSLGRNLMIPAAQSKIRQEVMSVGELEAVRENREQIYPNLTPPEDTEKFQFEWQFDTNGEKNFEFLAKRRGISLIRLIIDMAVEVGFIGEAEYRRYLRQVEADSVVRPSVPLQYLDGSLYRGEKLVGTISQRSPPTGPETVLQIFQEQGWPNNIKAPEKWGNGKVKRVCKQLRNHFSNEIHFGEGDGGKTIRMHAFARKAI